MICKVVRLVGWVLSAAYQLFVVAFESLHAHVRFNNGAIVNPGDEVIVHGDPVKALYGEVITEDREATILRATSLERLWTRIIGKIEFMEICEFSFSEEVSL